MLQARRKVATSLIVRKSALEKYRVVSDIQGLVYAPPTAGDEGAAIVARAGIAHYDSFGGADVVLEGGYGYGSKPNKRRRVIRARGQSQGSAEHEWVKEHPPQEVIQPGRKGKIVARTAGGSYAYSAAAALAFMKDPDFVNETRGRRNLVHIANCEGDHLCGATLDQRTQEGYRPAESLFDFSPAYAREDEDDDEDYAAPVGKKRKAPSAPSPAPRKRTKRSSKSSMDYEHDLNSPTLTKEQIRDVARDLGGVGNSDAPRFVVDQDGSDEIPAEAQEVLLSMVDSDAATIASPETVQLLQLRRLNDSHVFVKARSLLVRQENGVLTQTLDAVPPRRRHFRSAPHGLRRPPSSLPQARARAHSLLPLEPGRRLLPLVDCDVHEELSRWRPHPLARPRFRQVPRDR